VKPNALAFGWAGRPFWAMRPAPRGLDYEIGVV